MYIMAEAKAYATLGRGALTSPTRCHGLALLFPVRPLRPTCTTFGRLTAVAVYFRLFLALRVSKATRGRGKRFVSLFCFAFVVVIDRALLLLYVSKLLTFAKKNYDTKAKRQ